MATYAVGDIQGCYGALQRLLEMASFDRARDRVWLTGDLVNRGPDSPGVLRWARGLGDRAVVVLGNHDLHLLAIAHGKAREGTGARCRDTLVRILGEPDGRELLDWLGRQKLMHHEDGLAMVHAGLLPEWSIAQALELAREVETELHEAPARLFERMYGDEPAKWSEALDRADRHRIVINAMTRIRMLNRSGEMDLVLLGRAGEGADGPHQLVRRTRPRERSDANRVRPLGRARARAAPGSARARHRMRLGSPAHRRSARGPSRVPGALRRRRLTAQRRFERRSRGGGYPDRAVIPAGPGSAAARTSAASPSDAAGCCVPLREMPCLCSRR